MIELEAKLEATNQKQASLLLLQSSSSSKQSSYYAAQIQQDLVSDPKSPLLPLLPRDNDRLNSDDLLLSKRCKNFRGGDTNPNRESKVRMDNLMSRIYQTYNASQVQEKPTLSCEKAIGHNTKREDSSSTVLEDDSIFIRESKPKQQNSQNVRRRNVARTLVMHSHKKSTESSEKSVAAKDKNDGPTKADLDKIRKQLQEVSD